MTPKTKSCSARVGEGSKGGRPRCCPALVAAGFKGHNTNFQRANRQLSCRNE